MRVRVIAVSLVAAAALWGCGPTAEEKGEMSDIDARLAKYARVVVSRNVPGLKDNQRDALDKLIEAGHLIDEIFWMQASSDGPDLFAKLLASEDESDAKLLRFLKINKGRFDRAAGNEPFIGTQPKPAGATFWPEDLTTPKRRRRSTARRRWCGARATA